MRTKDISKSSTKIFILLGQFIFLLLAFIYLDYIYLMNVRKDQIAKLEYVQAECLIMSKKLSTKGKFIRRYRADFLINYHANGVQYNRWVSGNGLDASYSVQNHVQTKLLSEFKNGSNYSCWYNPKNAEQVFLVERHSWLAVSTFLVALAGLITLIFFIKNALFIFRAMKE